MDWLEKLEDSAAQIQAARRQAMKALSLCKSMPQLSDFRNKMRAMEEYHKARNESIDAILLASEMRLRAERVIGTHLLANKDAKRQEFGLTPHVAVTLRTIAKIPIETFEAELKQLANKKKVASHRHFLRFIGYQGYSRRTFGCKMCRMIRDKVRTFIETRSDSVLDELDIMCREQVEADSKREGNFG